MALLDLDSYPNMGNFNFNDRVKMEAMVFGNCCWRVFQMSRFRGKSANLGIGFDGLMSFQPKSIKKEVCNLSF